MGSYVASLNRALDGGITGATLVVDPLDALKTHVTLHASEDLGKHYNEISQMSRAWAASNDCVLHRLAKLKTGHGFVLEILTKYRTGPSMDHDPMKGEKHVKFSRR